MLGEGGRSSLWPPHCVLPAAAGPHRRWGRCGPAPPAVAPSAGLPLGPPAAQGASLCGPRPGPPHTPLCSDAQNWLLLTPPDPSQRDCPRDPRQRPCAPAPLHALLGGSWHGSKDTAACTSAGQGSSYSEGSVEPLRD